MHDLTDLLYPLAVECNGTEELRIATKTHMSLVVLSSLQLMRALKSESPNNSSIYNDTFKS